MRSRAERIPMIPLETLSREEIDDLLARAVPYDDFMSDLKQAVRDAGSQIALHRKLGVRQGFVSNVLNGHKRASRQMLRQFGYDMVHLAICLKTKKS